jgi:hypothetical protein
LDKSGTPIMLYDENGAAVEDALIPDPEGKSFTHIVKRANQENREVLSW